MSLVEQLKRSYDELPWPHHLVISAARYEEARRELPAPETPHAPSLFDLHICVGEIPEDEIHFVDRRGNVYKVEKIGAPRAAGRASPLLGIDPSGASI